MKLYVVMAGDEPYLGGSSSYRREHIHAFTSEKSARRSLASTKAQAKYGKTPGTHIASFTMDSESAD